MPIDPKPLTRDQLAKFLPDQEAIKRFERLFQVAGDLTPADVAILYRLAQEASIDAGIADAKANQALSELGAISDDLHKTSTAVVETEEPQLPSSRVPSVEDLADVLVGATQAGQLLIYDATLKSWINAVLTPGSNVAITNADGSVTIAVSGAPPTGGAGGVLSGSYPNPGFAVDMATQAELNTAIGTREPTIAAGTTSQYWRGDKSWQDFFANVRAATLTGLNTATNAVITAADTVLSALGKLQKQITDHLASTAAHGATGAVVGTTNTQTLTNKTLSAPVVTGTTDLQGGQIKFPTTQVPSSDPNTLDDYEEGTFTPTITPATGSFTTVTLGTCSYTKVGNLVAVSVRFTLTSAGTGGGAITISGLPFTASSLYEQRPFTGRRVNDGITLFGQISGSTLQDLVKIDRTTGILDGYLYTASAIYSV